MLLQKLMKFNKNNKIIIINNKNQMHNQKKNFLNLIKMNKNKQI